MVDVPCALHRRAALLTECTAERVHRFDRNGCAVFPSSPLPLRDAHPALCCTVTGWDYECGDLDASVCLGRRLGPYPAPEDGLHSARNLTAFARSLACSRISKRTCKQSANCNKAVTKMGPT